MPDDAYDYKRKKEEPSGFVKFLADTLKGMGMTPAQTMRYEERKRQEAKDEEDRKRQEAERKRKADKEYWQQRQKREQAADRIAKLQRAEEMAKTLASTVTPQGQPEMYQDNELGLPAGPMSETGRAQMFSEELATRPAFTPTGQSQAIQQAREATEAAHKQPKPEKPKKITKEDWNDMWEDHLESFGGDKAKAWEAANPRVKQKLRFHKIYDPEKETAGLLEDAKKELARDVKAWRKGRQMSGNTWFQKPQPDLMSVILDTAYGGKYHPLIDALYSPEQAEQLKSVFLGSPSAQDQPMPQPAGQEQAPQSAPQVTPQQPAQPPPAMPEQPAPAPIEPQTDQVPPDMAAAILEELKRAREMLEQERAKR